MIWLPFASGLMSLPNKASALTLLTTVLLVLITVTLNVMVDKSV